MVEADAAAVRAVELVEAHGLAGLDDLLQPRDAAPRGRPAGAGSWASGAAIAVPTSSSGRCVSSSSEHACSLTTAIRSNSSSIRIPYGAPATSASSWEESRRPSSSAARVRVTSRPVISTAIALAPRKRSVAWPSTQTQRAVALAQADLDDAGARLVRAGLGERGAQVGDVERVRERAPQAADHLVLAQPERGAEGRAGVLDQPVAVEHPDQVGGVVDERGDARGLARLGLGLGDLRVGGDDRAVGQRRRARGDPDVAAVGVRDAELLVDAGVAALRRARRGSAPAEASRRRVRAAGSRRSARRSACSAGRPTNRPIASLALRTTPSGSKTRIRVLERLPGASSGGEHGRHRPAPIRYPTPRTVATKSGDRGSSRSLRRRLEMWTSTRWSSPNQFSPQTRSSSWARLNATRGCAVSVSSRSNSIRVSSSVGAVEDDLAGERVERQRAELPRRCSPAGWCGASRAAARAPQDGLHASDELRDAERLGDVVVGARLEPDDLVELGVLRGEHQDVGVAEGAHAAADLDAVDVGQADVEDDQVQRVRLGGADGGFTVFGLVDVEALLQRAGR